MLETNQISLCLPRPLPSKKSIETSRGGKITNVYAVVDVLGNPVHFILTGGQVHVATTAIPLLKEVSISRSNLAIRHMFLTRFWSTLLPVEQLIQFSPRKIAPSRGFVIFTPIRDGIL